MYKCECGHIIRLRTSVVLPGEKSIEVEIDWICPKCKKPCSQRKILAYSEGGK